MTPSDVTTTMTMEESDRFVRWSKIPRFKFVCGRAYDRLTGWRIGLYWKKMDMFEWREYMRIYTKHFEIYLDISTSKAAKSHKGEK